MGFEIGQSLTITGGQVIECEDESRLYSYVISMQSLPLRPTTGCGCHSSEPRQNADAARYSKNMLNLKDIGIATAIENTVPSRPITAFRLAVPRISRCT